MEKEKGTRNSGTRGRRVSAFRREFEAKSAGSSLGTAVSAWEADILPLNYSRLP